MTIIYDAKAIEIVNKHMNRISNLDLNRTKDKSTGTICSTNHKEPIVTVNVRGKTITFNYITLEMKINGKFNPDDVVSVSEVFSRLRKDLVTYYVQENKENNLKSIDVIKKEFAKISESFRLNEREQSIFNSYLNKYECRIENICHLTKRPLGDK